MAAIRKFRAIVLSNKAPEDKEVLWLNNGSLKYYNIGEWRDTSIDQSLIDNLKESLSEAKDLYEELQQIVDDKLIITEEEINKICEI